MMKKGFSRKLLMIVLGLMLLMFARFYFGVFGISLGYLYVALISLSGYWFGIRGGVLCALAGISIFVLELSVFQDFELRHLVMRGLPVRTAVYIAAGVVMGWVSNIEKNIRKDLEKDVAQKTQELNEAHEINLKNERFTAMGKTGGVIAHEIRNQLGVIKNVAYLLELHLKHRDETTEKYLKMLHDQTDHMNLIVQNILDFSRQKTLKIEQVDLNSLVKESIDRARAALSANLEIMFDANESNILVMGDRVKLSQIFDNLIRNASEAMAGKGVLYVSLTQESSEVLVEFKDTGCGIPSDKLVKIFEPLFTTKSTGTGFGLATVRELLKRHNGDVSVCSEVGRGTTFTVKLPLNADFV